MTTLTKKVTSFGIWFVLFTALFIFTHHTVAWAGSLINEMESDIDTFGTAAGLDASQDPRVTIFRIINVTLGILGLVLTILIIYGGFTWMTAGGSEEKVTKAKKILANSTVGVFIIIVAYAISTWVFDTIKRSVN